MKKIAVIALDGALASTLANLPDIARTANIFIGERLGKVANGDRLVYNKPARVVWEFLSLDGRAPAGAYTSLLRVTRSITEATELYDLVFVPALSWSTPESLFERLDTYAPLYPWLRDQWQRGAVIASICTGTVLLAEAGLLDDRPATTCWWLEEKFRQRYPSVNIDIRRDITEQNRIFCAAALDLNTRLSLSLMTRFLSPDIGNLLAKSVAGFDVDDELVARTQYWFQKNMAKKVSLTDAADSLLVSGTTLVRYFKKTLGITPRAYLQDIRMDTAKGMLLNTDMPIEAIVEQVGYRDWSFFQLTFRKYVGLTPNLYRKRFGRKAMHG